MLPVVAGSNATAALAAGSSSRVTVCHFVPSALAAFLAAAPSSAAFVALRLVVCSGEPCRPGPGAGRAGLSHRRPADRQPGTDRPGPRSTSPNGPGTTGTGPSVPIGSPHRTTIPCTSSTMRCDPQPSGAVGELYLAGPTGPRLPVAGVRCRNPVRRQSVFVPGGRMYDRRLVHPAEVPIHRRPGRRPVKVRGRRIGRRPPALPQVPGASRMRWLREMSRPVDHRRVARLCRPADRGIRHLRGARPHIGCRPIAFCVPDALG